VVVHDLIDESARDVGYPEVAEVLKACPRHGGRRSEENAMLQTPASRG